MPKYGKKAQRNSKRKDISQNVNNMQSDES